MCLGVACTRLKFKNQETIRNVYYYLLSYDVYQLLSRTRNRATNKSSFVTVIVAGFFVNKMMFELFNEYNPRNGLQS